MNLVLPRGDTSSPSFKKKRSLPRKNSEDISSGTRKKHVFVRTIKQALGVSHQRDRLSDFDRGSRSLKLLTSAEGSLIDERRQSADLPLSRKSRDIDVLSADSQDDLERAQHYPSDPKSSATNKMSQNSPSSNYG